MSSQQTHLAPAAGSANIKLSRHLSSVFGIMAIGAALMAYIAQGLEVWFDAELLVFLYQSHIAIGLLIAQVLFALALYKRVRKLGTFTSLLVLAESVVVNALVAGAFCIAWLDANPMPAFMVAAGIYAILSIASYFARTPLNMVASFAISGLLGMILAVWMNLFVVSNLTLSGHTENLMALSVLVILGVAGFTAFHIRQVKLHRLAQMGHGEDTTKAVLHGAVTYSLDYIYMPLRVPMWLWQSALSAMGKRQEPPQP